MSRNDIIKEIQQLRNQKLSYQKVADSLNERKISTLSGRGKWNKNTVSRLISHNNDKIKASEKKSLIKVKQNKKTLIKELEEVKQQNVELYKQLNKVKQKNKTLKEVKHHKERLDKDLISVKQLNSELENELNKVKQTNTELQEKLNRVKQIDQQKSTDQEKKNVDGWSIQKSGGYYRLFKKIAGKVHGIYLGKTINEEIAKKKILRYIQGL